jgi:hypothetical protein
MARVDFERLVHDVAVFRLRWENPRSERRHIHNGGSGPSVVADRN